MFKRLKKSVIDKNNSLLSNLTKKRVNKTPSKIIFPYRTNLAFANIIVNMNQLQVSEILNLGIILILILTYIIIHFLIRHQVIA